MRRSCLELGEEDASMGVWKYILRIILLGLCGNERDRRKSSGRYVIGEDKLIVYFFFF